MKGLASLVGVAVVALGIALCIDSGLEPGETRPLSSPLPLIDGFHSRYGSRKKRAVTGTSTSTSTRASASARIKRRLEDDEHGHGEGEEEEEEGEEEAETDQGLLFAALMLGFGVATKSLLDLAGKYFPLPYTVALVLFGCLFGSLNSIGTCTNTSSIATNGTLPEDYCSDLDPRDCKEEGHLCEFVSTLPSELGMLGTSVEVWATINPEFLLYFFIPALVYASAHTVDVHIFLESFINVLALAIPGVLLATYLMFWFFFYTYHDNDRYGWSFDAVMAFGAILSATDPVAVVAMLDELGAPHKLSIAIEGESLLNDGTALVVYSIFREALLGNRKELGEQFGFFFQLALGGFALGVIIGAITVFVLQFLNSSLLETTWTLAAAYLTFFACEKIHFSGVLGVVFLGVVVSFFGKTRMTSNYFMESFWSMWNFIANTLIFSIAGVIIAESIFYEDRVKPEDVGLFQSC